MALGSITTYPEMEQQTKQFYKSFCGIRVSRKFMKDAIASLTLEQYKEKFNHKSDEKIEDGKIFTRIGRGLITQYFFETIRKPKEEFSKLEEFLEVIDQTEVLAEMSREALPTMFALPADLRSETADFEVVCAIAGFINLYYPGEHLKYLKNVFPQKKMMKAYKSRSRKSVFSFF